MNPIITSWAQVLLIVVSLLFAVLWNTRQLERAIDQVNKRIDDLRSEMNHRFDDLKDLMRAELKRIDERLERLEHPVTKP